MEMLALLSIGLAEIDFVLCAVETKFHSHVCFRAISIVRKDQDRATRHCNFLLLEVGLHREGLPLHSPVETRLSINVRARGGYRRTSFRDIPRCLRDRLRDRVRTPSRRRMERRGLRQRPGLCPPFLSPTLPRRGGGGGGFRGRRT